jgi:hypothetical protein
MRLPPAWRVTFKLRLLGRGSRIDPSGFRDSVATTHFELRAEVDREARTVASLAVTSMHPYRADALTQCLRAARDACGLVSLRLGEGRVLEVFGTPKVERLEGAKDPGASGISITSSAAVSTSWSLKPHREALEAAEEIEGDSDLRADLDTYRLATLEEDQPTRLIHLWRILDRHANAQMASEPPLLEADEQRGCVEALLTGLPERLDGSERERVAATVRNAIGRVRARPRPEVLSERFSGLTATTVTSCQVRELASVRGRHAHGTSERGSTSEGELESLLLTLVKATLTERDARRHISSPASCGGPSTDADVVASKSDETLKR